MSNANDGVLTVQMIENAALMAIKNFGSAKELIFPDEGSAKRFLWSMKFHDMSPREKALYKLLYDE